ncbi:MAG: MBL fold metallo-hydrolase [Verrucomicrobiota bacterium]|nr:MBL fold metallo-hydrolase [Verrucomicrobiota bacterium]
MAKLTFLGAAGTVTGSRHFLELNGRKLLIDCGLFQGKKAIRQKNWEPFPIAPSTIDSILLTHAHIDHTGFLPRLVREGFGGKIISTHATADLCKYLLPDTGHLQEEEAKYANKKGTSKHTPALPLFTVQDAEKTLTHFSPVEFGDHVEVAPGYRAKWRTAGHILGAAFLDIKSNGEDHPRKIVFGGDLGRPRDEVLREPAQAYNVDYLVLESTYGDRLHSPMEPRRELARVVHDSIKRGGVLIIPAFAVGRTQTLLYTLRELEEEGLIPSLPIYVDSPMAIGATGVFDNRIADLNLFCRKQHLGGKALFRPRQLHFAQSVQQSMAINGVTGPAIIISASGMVAGGRILHHLKERMPDARNTVLFIGYQAEGTRGRMILDGMPSIKMYGEEVPVKAKIESIQGFSGHADYNEILGWLMGFNRKPERVFIVHGEPSAANAMAERIRNHFGWDVVVPHEGQSFELRL